MRSKAYMCLVSSLSALLAAGLALGCSSGLNSTASTAGSISGRAIYSNQSDSGGIIITAESANSGKTAYVRALEAGSRSVTRAIAAQVTTASTGVYLLSNLSPGTYTVYASSKNSLEKAVTTNVTVTAGKDVSASDLNLTATGSISGTISISGVSPLGAVVFVAGTSYAAFTDSSGSYAISAVPVGASYSLYAEKGSYDASATVSVAAGATTTQNLTLTQLPALSGPMSLEIDPTDTGKTVPGYYDGGTITELLQKGRLDDLSLRRYRQIGDRRRPRLPHGISREQRPVVLPHPRLLDRQGDALDLTLPDSGDYGQAQEPSSDSNGNILIRGDIYTSSGKPLAGYWKGSTTFAWTPLPLGAYSSGSMGTGITTLANSTEIEITAGFAQATTSSLSQPVVWILGNTAPITLASPFDSGGGYVGSINVLNSTLYISGYVYDSSGNSYPAYWSVLTSSVTAASTSLTFSTPVLLPQNGYGSSQCWGPASVNGSLFFFGETGGWSSPHPLYWRDGTAQPLVLPATAPTGYSSWGFPYNGTMYITGELTSSAGLGFPVVWKDGQVIIIDLGTKYFGDTNSF